MLATPRRTKRSIPRQTLHREVIERLREMIIEGELAPGQRIDENALSEDFGISRTPLREALKVLASEGLVDLKPNRSPHVSRLTAEELGELFEVLSWLERLAGELAATRITEDDADVLRSLHTRMVQHHLKGERHEYFQLNRQLHSSIVAIAGNSVLLTTYNSLMIKNQRARYIAILSQEHWDRGVREHAEAIDALTSKDGKRAGKILMDHARQTGTLVMNAIISGEGDTILPPASD